MAKSRYNKIYFIATLVIFTLIFSPFCGRKNKWEGNILFITLDTTRADHIGSYGYKAGSTPNIDKLAQEGIKFENCYSSVPLTLPAHCNIFTGKYSIGHGVRNNGRYILNDNETTMAELFRSKGYETYAVIAAFVLHSKFGLSQGFDIYDDSIRSKDIYQTMKSQISADLVYDKFEKWISKNYEKKFFAWVHFYDPHSLYLAHEEFATVGEKDSIKRYDGEISFTDKYIGKIIKNLEEKNIIDNTLVVIVGDHGEAFGEHKEYASHMVFCYEENLKVPLIFYNRKLFPVNKSLKKRIDTIDIMPTLLGLAGEERRNDIQGKNLTGYIEDGKDPNDRTIYIESMYGKEEFHWAPLTGIIDGDYKYISLPVPELYNLKKDKGEQNNLFRKKGSISREKDKKLKDLILKFSRKDGVTSRKLGKDDIEHLKSLGYISSFDVKGSKNIDPKKGIILDTKLKRISKEIDSGNIKETEMELKEILKSKMGEENFLVYHFLYRIYKKKNDLVSAMGTLEKAMKKLPDTIQFRINYALNLLRLKKYDDVLENCKKIIDIDPLYTRTYIILGNTYFLMNDFSSADKNYRKAIKLEPKNSSLKTMFSEKLLSRGLFSETLKVYESLLENGDILNNVEMLYKIALFNTKYGTLSRSVELLKRIIDIKPGGKYYYYYALVLAKSGDKINALRNMRTALEKYGSELDERMSKAAQKNIEIWGKNNY